jgi:hypothetical protein
VSTTEAGDASNYPLLITIPSDGDNIDAASVNVAFEGLADRTAYLAAREASLASIAALAAIAAPTNGLVRNVLGFGLYTFATAAGPAALVSSPWVVAPSDATPGKWINATTYARFASPASLPTVYRSVHPCAALGTTNGTVPPQHDPFLLETHLSSMGDVNSFSFVFGGINTGAAEAKHIVYPIDHVLLQSARIAGAEVFITPSGGHGTFPALLPGGWLVRVAHDGTVSPLRIARSSDSTVGLANYELNHAVNILVNQNDVVDLENYSYYLVFHNEGHTDAIAGLEITGVRIAIEVH